MRKRSLVCLGCLVLAGCGRQRPPALPPISEVQMGDQSRASRLLGGFYEPNGVWRWTSRVFAVSLDPPESEAPTYLVLDCSLSPELMSGGGAATLTARINGVEVGRETYTRPDRYTFSHRVPPAALRQKPSQVEFELDKSITDRGNGRVLGLIAVSVALVGYEQTEEYRAAWLRMAREGFRQLSQRRHLPISQPREIELIKLLHDLPVWESLWFHNVRIIKNPLDLWIMQQIIDEVRPDFVIETGTWMGGSALFWAHTLKGMGLEKSRVLTVDILDFTQAASAQPLWGQYVEFFHGSSTDPAIVSAIARRVKGRKTVITLDSSHVMQHVLNELRMYSPMVSRGSYIVVEDTHLDGVPTHPEQGPGPFAAVLEFLQQGGGREFEQDLSRETLAMTWNAGGWLRRR